MKYGICLLAQIPVRDFHSEKSEMVTQLLFGETCKIINQKDSWYFIYSDTDQYLGWVNVESITIIPIEEYLKIEGIYHPCVSSAFAQLETNDEKIIVSQGSTLPFLKENKFAINGTDYKLTQGSTDQAFSASEIAKNIAGAPYLWGGRTMLGIDCSGLIVNIFKILHFDLPRDASEQIAYGEPINFLNEAQEGDLCFFDNENGKIIHVGILIDNQTIVHASGKVRIDKIDHQGIYNNDLKKYTHHLRIIKRIKLKKND
ncbi:MAG: hypothetical protein C0599_17560 [Salinivirgaceae bacterium]|nr:MAG: hypothetical protein C0599_17560 [Salinivirgaceae bacterium]